MSKVVQTRRFKNMVKKLPSQQKLQLDRAVKEIINNPKIGQRKVGDLARVYIYKLKLDKQLTLVAYTYENKIITLLNMGTHENFYRDLKRSQ